MSDELPSTVLPIQVGKTKVLARVTGTWEDETGVAGETQVNSLADNFDNVVVGIEEMSRALMSAFEKVCPDKVSVEFNVALSWESKKLVALFFDHKGSGAIKVNLQWGKDSGEEKKEESEEDEDKKEK